MRITMMIFAIFILIAGCGQNGNEKLKHRIGEFTRDISNDEVELRASVSIYAKRKHMALQVNNNFDVIKIFVNYIEKVDTAVCMETIKRPEETAMILKYLIDGSLDGDLSLLRCIDYSYAQDIDQYISHLIIPIYLKDNKSWNLIKVFLDSYFLKKDSYVVSAKIYDVALVACNVNLLNYLKKKGIMKGKEFDVNEQKNVLKIVCKY